MQLVSRTLRHSSVAITDKFYSDYVLDDLIGTINDSPLIKQALSPEQLLDKAIKAFNKVIGSDQRVGVDISRDNHGNAVIKVRGVYKT